jgi:hypothetical protein
VSSLRERDVAVIHKPIDAVTADDLVALVANRSPEGRSLDYKEALPGNADADRKDFLADVSSFANTVGGYIVYGISEERDLQGQPTGIPAAISGLAENVEAAITGLEGSARDGIEPRISGMRLRSLFAAGNSVILCWIPRSIESPHLVTYRGHSKFYARATNGKFPLDVQQIRSAFVASGGLAEGVRRFRQERLARIASDDVTFRLQFRSHVVLHIVPLAMFGFAGESGTADLDAVVDQRLFSRTYTDFRYNFDGVMRFLQGQEGTCWRYLQVFRNGIVESVHGVEPVQAPGPPRIASVVLERDLLDQLSEYLTDMARMGIHGPLLVMVSLVGVSGLRLATPGHLHHYVLHDRGPIDRDILALPEVQLDLIPETPDLQAAARILRQPIDVLWQSAGFDRSPSYNNEGAWAPR